MKMFQKTQSESLDTIFYKAVALEEKAEREKALQSGLAELERKLKIIELNSSSKITEGEINRMVFWRIKFLLSLIGEDLTDDTKKEDIKKCKEVVEGYSNLSYDFRHLPLNDREELFEELSNLYKKESFGSSQYCLFQIALGEQSESFKELGQCLKDSILSIENIISSYSLYLFLTNYDQELSKKITLLLLDKTSVLPNGSYMQRNDYDKPEETRKTFFQKTTSIALLDNIIARNETLSFANVLYRNKEIAFVIRMDLFEQALQKCKIQRDKDILNCYMGLMLLEESKPKEANKYLKSISIDSEMYSKSRSELGDYYKAHLDYEKAEIYYFQCLGSYGMEKAEIKKFLDGEKIYEGDIPQELEHVKDMLLLIKEAAKKMDAIKGKEEISDSEPKRIGWKQLQ